MSAYEPPTAVYPIFDSLAFQTPNSASLTLAEGDLRYLARNNIAISNALQTSFAGDVTIGNSILDYTAGTGLTIRGTANGESIFMNVLNAGGATRLKIELNPTHLHLYDAIRFTDSSAPTNFTTLQQILGVCNMSNTTVNSSITNFLTRTSGGVNVTPLSISAIATTINGDVRYVDRNTPSIFSTLTQASNTFSFQNTSINGGTVNFEVNTTGGVPIEPVILSSTQVFFSVPLRLDYTITPVAGQLGFRTKTIATASTAITTGSIITLITGGFSLGAGTYLIILNGHITTTAVAGTVTSYELGISTANNSFTGGFSDVVLGTYNVPAIAGVVTGQCCEVLNVTATTTYFFNHRLTFATIVPTISTANTYIQYTRIA